MLVPRAVTWSNGAIMYEIKRKDGRVSIYDWEGKTVYGMLVIYRGPNGELQVAEVKSLTDTQLLTALASAVKLPF